MITDPTKPSVLIIEDDEDFTRLLSFALKRFDVSIARDGESALSQLHDRAFDAVLCDMGLPGMSGREVYQRVACDNPEAAARFVFVTGGGVEPADKDFILSTDNRVLNKPVLPSQLRSVLHEVTAR